MSQSIVYLGSFDRQGKVVLNKDEINKSILALSPKPFRIIIEPRKNTGDSPGFRGYLFGVAIEMIADYLGYKTTKEKKMLYYELKGKFLTLTDGKTGLDFVPPLSSLDGQERLKFMADITEWAEEFCGIFLPPPDRSHVEHYDNLE